MPSRITASAFRKLLQLVKPGHPRRREVLQYKARIDIARGGPARESKRRWLAADYAMRIHLPMIMEAATDLSPLALIGRSLDKIETWESLNSALIWLRQVEEKLREIFGSSVLPALEGNELAPNRSKRSRDGIHRAMEAVGMSGGRIVTISQFALVLAGTDLAKLSRQQRRRIQNKHETAYIDATFGMLDRMIALDYHATPRDAETLRASLPPRAQEGIDALLARGATLALQPGGIGLLLTCEAASTPDGLRTKLSKSLPGSRWSTELDRAVTLHWWA